METLLYGGAAVVGFFVILWLASRMGELKELNRRLDKESEVANDQKQALADRPSAVDRLRDGKF